MILHKKNVGKWTDYDHALAEAFDIYESELCEQCGNSIYLCDNADENDVIHSKVLERTCNFTIQKENYRKTNYKDGLPEGYALTTAMRIDEDVDPADLRDDYYADVRRRISEAFGDEPES